jgi:hypothetical protein
VYDSDLENFWTQKSIFFRKLNRNKGTTFKAGVSLRILKKMAFIEFFVAFKEKKTFLTKIVLHKFRKLRLNSAKINKKFRAIVATKNSLNITEKILKNFSKNQSN